MNVAGLGKWQVKQEIGGQRNVINGIYFSATSTGELNSPKTLSSSRNCSLLCFCTLRPSNQPRFPHNPVSAVLGMFDHLGLALLNHAQSCTMILSLKFLHLSPLSLLSISFYVLTDTDIQLMDFRDKMWFFSLYAALCCLIPESCESTEYFKLLT